MQIVQQGDVQAKLVEIRGQRVLIDADIAVLYGVETKRINEAVKNNRKRSLNHVLFTVL